MRKSSRFLGTATFVVALLACPATLLAEDAAVTFRQNCMSCHTIGGGRLVGPDLKNVTQRKEREWLTRFIPNPKSFLDGGDPYARKLKDEAGGAVMPVISGLTPERASLLLDLIEAESKLPKSQFQGLNIGVQPFTPADIRAGRDIFVGARRLTNGGAQCISCHTANGIKGLGGGQLGPDLTRVYERLQGRKNLAAWLQAPATPTMRPQFVNSALTNDEIVGLVAFLESEARRGGQGDNTPQLGFIFLGIGGAVAALIGADAIWRGRFRSSRRAMVDRMRRR